MQKGFLVSKSDSYLDRRKHAQFSQQENLERKAKRCTDHWSTVCFFRMVLVRRGSMGRSMGRRRIGKGERDWVTGVSR